MCDMDMSGRVLFGPGKLPNFVFVKVPYNFGWVPIKMLIGLIGDGAAQTTSSLKQIYCDKRTMYDDASSQPAPQAPPRKKAQQTTRPNIKRTAPVTNRKRTMRTRPEPTSVNLPLSDCSDMEEDKEPEANKPYDIRTIVHAGNLKDVTEAATLRDWDQDIIDRILEIGGKPPLVQINNIFQSTNYKMVNCTFRALNGTTVQGIYIPRSLINFLYPDKVYAYEMGR